MVYGGLDVTQYTRVGQALHLRFQRNTSGNVVRRVAHLNTKLDPVKGRWRQCQVTLRSQAVCHRTNVGIDAKDFL